MARKLGINYVPFFVIFFLCRFSEMAQSLRIGKKCQKNGTEFLISKVVEAANFDEYVI